MKATMKNVLSMLLVVTLTASLAIGGTMAYLTMDAGDEKNVFSIGNIDVSLDEEVDIFGEGGEVKETEEGAEYIEVMPGDYLKKEVTVTNNGKTDAYVAVTVLLNNADKINDAIDEVYGDGSNGGQAMYDFIFDGWGINQNPRPGKDGGISFTGNANARGVIDGAYGLPDHTLHVDFAKTTNGSTLIGADNWFIAGSEKAGQYWVDGPKAYDGYYTADMENYEICYTYYMYLPAGEASTLFNGLNVPAEFTNEQIKMFEGLEINVEASAIQADNMGIADIYNGVENGEAKTAFAILAGDITADKVNVNNAPETISGIATLEELKNAIASAKAGDTIVLGESIDLGSTQLAIEKNITLDLNGKTIAADNGWGIISLKNGASIENGTINVDTNVAAIRAFNAGTIENITIHVDPKATDKVTTGIAVQQNGYVETISNVTITGASQGIEVGKGAKVDLIENVNVTAVSNGTKEGIALQINAGNVGKVVDSTLNGAVYGAHMMLNGEYDVALTLENCDVTGETAGIYAHDEVGIDNNENCSLTLNYDVDDITGGVVTEFEAEALPCVTINGVKATSASVANNDELAAAITSGKTELTLADGEYTIPASAKGKTLTINGGKGAIIKMNTDSDNYDASDYNLDGSTVIFNGITHQAATSGTAQGYARATLTFNNCDLKGYMYLPETTVTTFNNCTFDVTGDLYCIWTWGSDKVYFTECTFNTDGKAILVYNASCDVYVKDCTFNENTNNYGFIKSAIETGVDGTGPKYNIYITNTTVNGYDENDKCVGYKNIVGNKNSMTQDYLNIVVDNVDVY